MKTELIHVVTFQNGTELKAKRTDDNVKYGYYKDGVEICSTTMSLDQLKTMHLIYEATKKEYLVMFSSDPNTFSWSYVTKYFAYSDNLNDAYSFPTKKQAEEWILDQVKFYKFQTKENFKIIEK